MFFSLIFRATERSRHNKSQSEKSNVAILKLRLCNTIFLKQENRQAILVRKSNFLLFVRVFFFFFFEHYSVKRNLTQTLGYYNRKYENNTEYCRIVWCKKSPRRYICGGFSVLQTKYEILLLRTTTEIYYPKIFVYHNII